MRCQSMVTRDFWNPIFSRAGNTAYRHFGKIVCTSKSKPETENRGAGVAGKRRVERSAKNPQKANRNCESPSPQWGSVFLG